LESKISKLQRSKIQFIKQLSNKNPSIIPYIKEIISLMDDNNSQKLKKKEIVENLNFLKEGNVLLKEQLSNIRKEISETKEVTLKENSQNLAKLHLVQ